MINLKYLLMVLVFSISLSNFCYMDDQPRYIPADGFIPDEKTAVAVAEAVLIPLFGEKIKKNKPFAARLENGIWYVSGTPKYTFFASGGGEPHVEIDKMTGQIINVYHTK